MKRFDKIFGGIAIGFVLLTIPSLIGWWVSYLWAFNIKRGTMVGVGVGIGVTVFLTKRIASKFYGLNTFLLMGLFLFYHIGVFGFFMGVPIFNILPGVMAGVYTGRKNGLNGDGSIIFLRELKKTNLFSVVVLLIISILSAYLALNDPYTADNLQGMLGIGFPISKEMLWGIIVCGGIVLMAAQYILSTVAGKLAYRKAL